MCRNPTQALSEGCWVVVLPKLVKTVNSKYVIFYSKEQQKLRKEIKRDHLCILLAGRINSEVCILIEFKSFGIS